MAGWLLGVCWFASSHQLIQALVVTWRSVANYVRRARHTAGYDSQKALGVAAGLSQQQISNYEKTGRVPLENLDALVAALKVPRAELLELIADAATTGERTERRQKNEHAERHAELIDRVTRLIDKYDELGRADADLARKLVELMGKLDTAAARVSQRLDRIDDQLRRLEGERRIPR